MYVPPECSHRRTGRYAYGDGIGVGGGLVGTGVRVTGRGVMVGTGVAVCVGGGVNVGVAVRVAVCVGVAVCVDVGVGVHVGGKVGTRATSVGVTGGLKGLKAIRGLMKMST